MNNFQTECYAELGSITQAMKARASLSKSAIPCSIIKNESSTGHGCTYSVSFSCNQVNNARKILSSAKISVKNWHTS